MKPARTGDSRTEWRWLGILAILILLQAPPAVAKGPHGTNSRLTAHERAAVRTLRSIASAQAQLVANVSIDTDADGLGEYGFVGELAGSAPLRIWTPAGPALEPGGTLSPPLLPQLVEGIQLLSGQVEVAWHGYRFALFLPGVLFPGNHIEGIPETGASGVGGATAGSFPDGDSAERLWACYAWPNRIGDTAQRAFFLNQEGRLLMTANDPRSPRTVFLYRGAGGGPDFDAALGVAPALPGGHTGMGAPLGVPPREAGDGNLWRPLE